MRFVAVLLAGVLLVAATIAAAAADAVAERRMGMAYYRGDGVKLDYARAVEHLGRAVDKGDAESAIRLGKMYEFGMGVAADDALAAQWYTRGAELGSPQAQFEASVMYYKGRGVARDPVEAVKWWTLAMRDEKYAGRIRASVESAEARLTPEELARGRQLALRILQACTAANDSTAIPTLQEPCLQPPARRASSRSPP
jgi:uncharacterized protein